MSKIFYIKICSSSHDSVVMNLTSIHEDMDLIPGLNQWVKDWRSLQMWPRSGMLWQWCRPAAVAPVQTWASELPYATGVALKKDTKSFIEKKHFWNTKWFESTIWIHAEYARENLLSDVNNETYFHILINFEHKVFPG